MKKQYLLFIAITVSVFSCAINQSKEESPIVVSVDSANAVSLDTSAVHELLIKSDSVKK